MTVADHLVPVWLVRFHAVQPSSSMALRVANSATVAAPVRDGEADIGFVEGSRAPSGLRARTVGHDELVVVVAPAHSEARRRRPRSAAELVAAR